MNKYLSIIFSAVFILIAFIPCQVLAASITQTSAAIGDGCTASVNYSTAMGRGTKASSYYSTAMGDSTIASGVASTAMGATTIASGVTSTAMGESTLASGGGSTAMGYLTEASGYLSTAIGAATKAGGNFSFAGGRYMQLTGTANNTFVWGDSTTAQSISTANAFLIFPAGTAGKVGIGTGSPNERLEVAGDGRAFFGDGGGGSRKGLLIDGNEGGPYARLEAYDFGASAGLDLVINTIGQGDVGIGTTSPSYKLHVNGTAAGTSWTNLSSRDFKEDIRKVSEAAHPMMLAKLMDMDLTTYKYKKEYGGEGDVKLGFIAEDMPLDVLSKDGKGVDVYELITLTIGAIKAQQKEIREQRRENGALKAKLEDVMARLEALEK